MVLRPTSVLALEQAKQLLAPALRALHENKGPVTTFFLNTSTDPSVIGAHRHDL